MLLHEDSVIWVRYLVFRLILRHIAGVEHVREIMEDLSCLVVLRNHTVAIRYSELDGDIWDKNSAMPV